MILLNLNYGVNIRRSLSNGSTELFVIIPGTIIYNFAAIFEAKKS